MCPAAPLTKHASPGRGETYDWAKPAEGRTCRMSDHLPLWMEIKTDVTRDDLSGFTG